MIRTRFACAGFTLIEVLVALAVVAVTLGAGLRAAAALTDNSERLGLITAAQWCADNELVRLRLMRQFPAVGDADFACRQMNLNLPGRLVVRPTPNPNFRRVDVVVLDVRTQPPQPLLTLTAIVYNQ